MTEASAGDWFDSYFSDIARQGKKIRKSEQQRRQQDIIQARDIISRLVDTKEEIFNPQDATTLLQIMSRNTSPVVFPFGFPPQINIHFFCSPWTLRFTENSLIQGRDVYIQEASGGGYGLKFDKDGEPVELYTLAPPRVANVGGARLEGPPQRGKQYKLPATAPALEG